jgi:predicted TIM-barrel fold metal-dependent hydrolase
MYFDISGLPPKRLLDYWPDLERLADQVLFGTDWPGASISDNLKAFRSIDLSDEAKQKILWANGSRILGLEGG